MDCMSMEMEDREFGDALLTWYADNRRSLPWREDPTPYHVWLSEIMLQQTRVEAVIGYYERFLAALPSVEDLAAAPEDVCLKLWEGLGYYSRVRNLHKAAVMVVSEYGGKLPRSVKDLRRLPGIGGYTAAAIASIAYGEPEPAIDGNLLRIFSRYTGYAKNIKLPAAAGEADLFYRGRMPEGKAGDFNQALMDLGAAVCMPTAQPRCGACPLRDRCDVHSARPGEELSLPVMPAKKERRVDELTVFVVRDGDRTVVRKRPAHGLLAGLYELPNAQGRLTAEEADAWLRGQGLEALRITPLPEARHIFTHREWRMQGYLVRIASLEGAPKPYILADADQIRGQYAVPSAFSAYMEYI